MKKNKYHRPFRFFLFIQLFIEFFIFCGYSFIIAFNLYKEKYAMLLCISLSIVFVIVLIQIIITTTVTWNCKISFDEKGIIRKAITYEWEKIVSISRYDYMLSGYYPHIRIVFTDGSNIRFSMSAKIYDDFTKKCKDEKLVEEYKKARKK